MMIPLPPFAHWLASWSVITGLSSVVDLLLRWFS